MNILGAACYVDDEMNYNFYGRKVHKKNSDISPHRYSETNSGVEIASMNEVDISEVDSSRKGINITSIPVTSSSSALVGAYIPKESTESDPIIQVDYKINGERKVYNIHINDVDPKDATDLEMFAYLSYQGSIGNKIPGAINNWDAFKILKREQNNFTAIDPSQGELLFTKQKYNAQTIVDEVYSWMKKLNHTDAKVQATWCEFLLKMFSDNK